MAPINEPAAGLLPLCVDLDGTLIRTDLLAESLLLLLKKNPLTALNIPRWCLQGRAALKRRLAERIEIDPAALPYDEALLGFLKDEKRSGRRLILATASDIGFARGVAKHLGLFSDVLGSDGKSNLAGAVKRNAIRALLGGAGFDYAGDSPRDLPIWQGARNAVLMRPSAALLEKVRGVTTVYRVFGERKRYLTQALRAIRPHQWVKNILIFVPYVTSHQLTDPELLPGALGAFFAFCLCASGVYVLNDLLDLAADRAHAVKKARPFASGDLPLLFGPPLALGLFTAAAAAAAFLPASFISVLALYAAITTLYSLYLKQVLLVDVFCLAGLYTLRIFAGHTVSGIAYSPWLFTFSMFIFLSLALLKRHTEVRALEGKRRKAVQGRAYRLEDTGFLRGLGTTSGYLSILVFALYINSAHVALLYAKPPLLWLICPVLLYWISRIWLLAGRGEVDADPVVFTLKDKTSYATGILIAVLLALAAK